MAATPVIQTVETYVGTVYLPAVVAPTGVAAQASATNTGVSAAQTATVTVGTLASPINWADASVLDLSLHVTAIAGTPPVSAGDPLPIAFVNLSRINPDAATLAACSADVVVSIPVLTALDVNSAAVVPTKLVASIGRGQQYNTDFGAYGIVQVVLASWVTSLTYSWSLQGKS